MIKRVRTCLFLIFLLWGCSGNQDSMDIPEHVQKLDNLIIIPPESKPLSSIRFEEQQQFGEIYPALLPPTVVAGSGPVTAVDRNGNVYRADRGKRIIHVYNPDGSPLTDIGGEGRGPGEFIRIRTTYIHQNRLVVYDSDLVRIQIFTLNPIELSRTVVLESQPWNRFDEVRMSRPSTVFGLEDSTFLAGVMLNDRNARSWFGYYILDWEGHVISDKIVEQQRLLNYRGTLDNGGEVYLKLPFTSKGIVDVGRDATIYHANSREFLIRIFRSDGEYLRAIYYPYERDPLEREEVLDQFHANLQSAVQNADFPDFWPALESMLVDDLDRIWVATIVNDKKVYEWWVLENSGELLAKFTWPSDETIQIVRNGKVYVGREDEETGARRVVRYRIEMEPI